MSPSCPNGDAILFFAKYDFTFLGPSAYVCGNDDCNLDVNTFTVWNQQTEAHKIPENTTFVIESAFKDFLKQ